MTYPREILVAAIGELQPNVNVDDAVLANYSIFNLAEKAVAIHGLLQAAMRETVPCVAATAEALVEVLVAVQREKARIDFPLMQQVLAHLVELIVWLETNMARTMVLAMALNACGNIHCNSFSDAQAILFYKRALAIKERYYGQDDVELAETLVNLGNAHGALDDQAKKMELLERALAIKERYYGPDHVEVAMTLANLGNAYGALGDTAKQKALLERALVIEEHQYGPDHAEVAKTLGSLGTAYSELGDHATTKAMLKRTLAIKGRHYGPDHAEMAITVFNLGMAYKSLGYRATAHT